MIKMMTIHGIDESRCIILDRVLFPRSFHKIDYFERSKNGHFFNQFEFKGWQVAGQSRWSVQMR